MRCGDANTTNATLRIGGLTRWFRQIAELHQSVTQHSGHHLRQWTLLAVSHTAQGLDRCTGQPRRDGLGWICDSGPGHVVFVHAFGAILNRFRTGLPAQHSNHQTPHGGPLKRIATSRPRATSSPSSAQPSLLLRAWNADHSSNGEKFHAAAHHEASKGLLAGERIYTSPGLYTQGFQSDVTTGRDFTGGRAPGDVERSLTIADQLDRSERRQPGFLGSVRLQTSRKFKWVRFDSAPRRLYVSDIFTSRIVFTKIL